MLCLVPPASAQYDQRLTCQKPMPYGTKVIPPTMSLTTKTAANHSAISAQPRYRSRMLSEGCFRLTNVPTAAGIQNNDSAMRAKAKAEGIGRKIKSTIAVPKIAGSAIIPIMALVLMIVERFSSPASSSVHNTFPWTAERLNFRGLNCLAQS